MALLAATALGSGCARDPRPHVVLITIDTLRADHLSAYGYGLETSPQIDALAAQGVLFERAIAASSATAPSHASLLTSLPVRRHSISYHNGQTRLEGERTLAQVLHEAGWATGAFVGNFMLQPRTGFDQGFDVFDSELTTIRVGELAAFERQADATAARAIAWVNRQREAPIFLWLHLQDPHGPYQPPAAEQGRFTVAAPADEPPLPLLEDRYGYRGIPNYAWVDGLQRPSQYEGRYADEIYFADRYVGEVLRVFDAHPGGRDTVVLLTSDHGEALGEGGYYYVHSHVTTPEIAHVPLILRAPGLRPERRRELVSHLDVMPTLLELAGVERPAGLQGLALGPHLRDGTPLPDRTVFCDMGLEISAYRGDRFERLVNVAPVLLDTEAIPEAAEAGEPAGPSWGTGAANTNPYKHGHAPRWWRYRWSPDGSFEPLAEPGQAGADGDASASLDPELLRYLEARAKRAVYNGDLEPADLNRLRALGYW